MGDHVAVDVFRRSRVALRRGRRTHQLDDRVNTDERLGHPFGVPEVARDESGVQPVELVVEGPGHSSHVQAALNEAARHVLPDEAVGAKDTDHRSPRGRAGESTAKAAVSSVWARTSKECRSAIERAVR